MIASVTENQLLASVFNHNLSFAVFGRGGPSPDTEFQSAMQQLRFIHNLAVANSTWMSIVTTPKEARKAINSNKLAIILSVEMDSLNAVYIIVLYNCIGLRHAIPIHLANNSFGGVALYGDKTAPGLFNTNNYYLNKEFFSARGDWDLEFQLEYPEVAALAGLGNSLRLLFGGQPTVLISEGEFEKLGYPVFQGHKNSRGLVKSELLKLMKKGILIDLAHMSEASQDDALELAQEYDYPVMNSHTGLRRDGEYATSERDMKHSHAARMAKLGGVIGLGTKAVGSQPVGNWVESYCEAFRVMGGRGVALGTDFNGFDTQIPFSEKAIDYPIRVPSQCSERMNGPKLNPLPKYQIGTRCYDFEKDGLAHYGMLPDFIQAISQDSQLKITDIEQLFRTAEATIQMWEKVEAAARNIP